MDWAFVLVIILSVFLALFLVLGIVLIVLLIRVTLQIRKVTTSAEKTAMNIENLVSNASRIVSPMILGKTVINGLKKMRNSKKGKAE